MKKKDQLKVLLEALELRLKQSKRLAWESLEKSSKSQGMKIRYKRAYHILTGKCPLCQAIVNCENCIATNEECADYLEKIHEGKAALIKWLTAKIEEVKKRIARN